MRLRLTLSPRRTAHNARGQDAAHDGCEDVGVDKYHSSGRRQLDASTCARARSTALAAGDGKNARHEESTAK